MSFIRPEAGAAVMRWRDALIGVAVVLLGLWWASGFGVLKWLGIAVVIVGAVLVYSGVQRARFRGDSGGQGVVQVDEGEVMYFGPLSGGTVAMADMMRLTLDGGSTPTVWILWQPGASPLHIPVDAEGAEKLFDAFATLPGLRMEHMLQQMQSAPDHPVVIWQKDSRALN